MNDRDLMSIRADTLFTYDARGRMLRSNEPEGRPAPRLFLGRTPGGHVARFGETVPVAVVRRLSEIIERQPPEDDLHLPTSTRAAVRVALERHAPITAETGGPAYRFPESVAPPNGVVRVTEANLALVRDTYPWLVDALDAWGPCFAVVRDGAAVSVCFSSRIGARACEAGVDTLPAFRGRGYASAVTAAWGAAVRAAGLIPLYSTAWDNLASQGVARRVGLIRFGANDNWA
jgi:RimJ/RimL family protein N-acetyltransferase